MLKCGSAVGTIGASSVTSWPFAWSSVAGGSVKINYESLHILNKGNWSE